MNDKIVIVAHRGIYNNNTIEAFQDIKNIKCNYNLGIEFDVNLSSDNHLIIHHDNVDETYNKLKEDGTIELKDVLEEFNGCTDYLLMIEIKLPSNIILKEYLNKIINLVNQYDINYVYSSFNKSIVNYIENCMYISDTGKQCSVTRYDLLKKYDIMKGIYTLYDDDFKDEYMIEVLNKQVQYLITDNVEKVIHYLDKYL